MSKMTLKQAKTLLAIVKLAGPQAWKVPTAKELSKELGIKQSATAGRRKRLIDNWRNLFIYKSAKDIKVNYDTLCTEKETAEFYLDIHEKLKQAEDGKIHKDDVIGLMGMPNRDEAERLLKSLIKTNYFELVELSGNIKEGPMLIELFEYIKMVARPDLHIVPSKSKGTSK